ncbi:metal-dependent hydrolase [Paradesulfitobacterium ferrireducens]|uniref:metal-dependent hydrolase n=1 Tax=Paradesulfitobacterium ferrireducens TaxID=2816476 RepID=UPI001A8FF49E|nr:metal-dependent hydrolase [Paradesulfitobacterium ferrireducens]
MHQVKWLGHSACLITSQQGTAILIDPWITGNPSCPVKREDLGRVDIILVSHDHFDHIGTDIPALVEASGATVVVQPELIAGLQEAGVKGDNIVSYGMGMNIGGTVEIKGIKITMTQALHSSAAGSPCGYIITLEDEKTIYHAGDTGIFAGMELLGEIYHLDLALVPIGSVFVMDPVQAAYSLRLLKAKTAVPIHYATFPILTQDASGFVRLAQEKAPDTQVVALKPGEEVSI